MSIRLNKHLILEEINCEFLISLVQDRPVLWDKLHESYKVREQTRLAWVEIFKAMNPWYEEMDEINQETYGTNVMKKWRNIVDSYNRSERHLKENLLSGKSPNRKYIYQEKLQFLKKNTGKYPAVYSLLVKNNQKLNIGEESKSNADLYRDQKWNIDEDSKSNICLESKSNAYMFYKVEDSDNDEDGRSPSQSSISDDPSILPVHIENILKKRKADSMKLELTSDPLKRNPNRHTSFFNGIIPSLELFDDDEVVEFQLKVLQVVSEIKKRKKDASILEQSSQSCSSHSFISNGIAYTENIHE